MMKLTGYKIREALRRWNGKRDAANALFEDSLRKFPGEDKKAPMEVMSAFKAADKVIAILQVAQDVYNLAVVVDVTGYGKVTLAEAVKVIGGVGRAEKMWRSAAKPKAEYRYSAAVDEVRKADEIRAVRVMKTDDVLFQAEVCARHAAALRQAIAVGNGEEKEISCLGLEPAFFD